MSSITYICLLMAVVALASANYYRPRQPAPAPSNYRAVQRPANYRPTTAPTYRRRPAPSPRHYAPLPSAGHTVIDECTCFEKGNYYSPVSSDDCRSFTQRTAWLPAETQKCPYGTQFDVKTCVCNHAASTYCPAYCPATAHYAPATAHRTCTANGNIYAQVPSTNCQQFTQATATLPPQRHYCPRGLQFDIKTCVCNYPADTRCYV